MKKEKMVTLAGGLVIGVIGAILVFFGNPKNMGFCIACFIRDTAGALKLHGASNVQYIRPEIIGIIIGSFVISLIRKEFRPRSGSSPIIRFLLGMMVMIGCLMCLGCPFRMALRLAGGDLNALIALLGFALGIGVGAVFLKKGFSLGRNYKVATAEGVAMPAIAFVLLVIAVTSPSFIAATAEGEGPGAVHALLVVSLAGGLIVGGVSAVTRLCMAGGIRDIILLKDTTLILGFAGVFVSALITNLILNGTVGGYFTLGMEGQPIAHTDVLWNILGMYLVGMGSVLLGGCPLRQLVLSGEGNADSAVTVLGLVVGAAIAHNFGLVSSADGPTAAGKAAVLICIFVTFIIGIAYCLKGKKNG